MRFLSPSQLGFAAIKNYSYPPHIRELEEHCLELIYGDSFDKLAIALPVRHGKSFMTSYILPAWYMITFPERDIIMTSYSKDFCEAWSGKIRDLIMEFGGEVQIDPRTRSKASWKTNKGGEFNTGSPTASIAGKGCHLFLADDLIATQADATNPVRRESLHKWFLSECGNRLHEGGKVMLTMSRRHPDDLTGRLIGGKEWKYLHYPALSDTGEALWPERYSKETLLKIRETYELSGSSYLWSCLHQSQPGGDPALSDFPESYFTDKIWYDELPPIRKRVSVCSFDPSYGSNSKSADFAAMLYGIIDRDGNVWIDDSVMARCPVDEAEDTYIGFCQRHKPNAASCETAFTQALILANLMRKDPKIPWYDFPVKEKKEVRIRLTLSPYLHAGRIRFRNTKANHIIVNQLKETPHSAHDDGPDALSQLIMVANTLLA